MPLLKPLRKIYVSQPDQPNLSKYGPAAGVGYDETVYRGGPMRAEWVRHTPGVMDVVRLYHHSKGAASLRNMAIRSVVANSRALTAETMECVPWQTAGRDVWMLMCREELNSFYTWRVFATAYAHEPSASTLKSRRQVIKILTMSLADYLQHIDSPSFQWITFLHLTRTRQTRTELANISSLTNLGALTVEGPDPYIDATIVRAWGRAAEAAGAFPMLRVLAFRRYGYLDPKVFEYLAQLPALSVLLVEDTIMGLQQIRFAEPHGWQHKTGKELNSIIMDGGAVPGAWDAVIRAAWAHGGKFCEESMTKEGVEAVDDLPVLNFHLGGEQRAAVVDKFKRDGLRSFVRRKRVGPSSSRGFFHSVANDNAAGKPSSQLKVTTHKRLPSTSTDGRPQPKKRTIKASRLVDNAFSDFGL